MLVQNKYTSCISNFCILNFLNNYTTYSRYLRKPTFFELSIPLKRSPSTKTEFFFFFAIQCEDMEKSRSASRRIGGGNGAITDPPRPLLSLFSWQSTLRPDTDKEFDHFHEFSRNVSILGQVFPAMGIKGGEFMTAYSMHLPGRKIHVCSTFSGNSR